MAPISISDIISEILKHELLGEAIKLHTKNYHGGKWDEDMSFIINDLFGDDKVSRINAKSADNSSHITLHMQDGSIIRGVAHTFPRKGEITINGSGGKWKKTINSSEAINLIPSMKKCWDEYLAKK